jgi:hypothetical protein
MKRALLALPLLLSTIYCNAQLNPAITSWLINTTGATGRHYLIGNPTPIGDATLANVQEVSYSSTHSYIKATGIPSYITGPYALGAVSVALNNNYTFKIPLAPVANTGQATSVGMGTIAVFINGTVAYNNRDAATYNNAGQWHQNAVYFENLGFDCAHGHPGPMSADYHVHQNPMAFNFSSIPASSVCNMYLADGLYVPNASEHSPLLGFASDGFPIYGGYGYADPQDSNSEIVRIESSYRLRNISSRTTLPNGTAATGPAFTDMITSMLPNSTPLPAVLGAYSEDFEFVAGLGDLDIHNGRICKTPEYPDGIYCYFATIDSDNNPVYPYLIGDTYYGVTAIGGGPGGANSFTQATVPAGVTVYNQTTSIKDIFEKNQEVNVYTSSDKELLVVQASLYQPFDRKVRLVNISGQTVKAETLYQGSTMCYFNLQTVYPGIYFVEINTGGNPIVKKVLIQK